MKIHGLQKLTLLDFPGHTACTVFFAGCNFRCPYCHNSELIDGKAEPVLTEEEFFSFLDTRKGLLDGVAITGGEPCLQKDLPGFARKIKEKGFLVKLDTNGTNPEMLEKMLTEGLVDYVAMDIKNSPERYIPTAGTGNVRLEEIEKSIKMLEESGIDHEFRTTVVKELHNEESFREIGKMLKGTRRYFLQPFVDRDTVVYNMNPPTEEEMKRYLEIIRGYIPNAEIRGE